MRHFDIAVIGTGSGNTIVNRSFAGRSVAIIERGVFGGTCINVGCIPTKMFVYPADLARYAEDGPRLGVHTATTGADWPQIRDRVFGRIDPIAVDGRDYRAHRSEGVTLFEGTARFTGERTLQVTTEQGDETITADQVVLAAGSRPVVPDIPGLDAVEHHTSDTVMRLPELPQRVGILGGGFIAAEFAHIFGGFGSQVSVVQRGPRLLRHQDDDVAAHFTDLATDLWDVHLDRVVARVEPAADGAIRLHLTGADQADGDPAANAPVAGDEVLEVDALLVATGRRSNADLLDLPCGGVETDPDGVVLVDEHQRTTAEGVWALGDLANHHQLKHVANAEARVIQHNLLHPENLRSSDRRFAPPSAVFTHPQIATVGMRERDAVEQGLRYVTHTQQYADVAYGWAMEEAGGTDGFVKILADPDTGLLLGAHLIGAHASSLIQPLVQAMTFAQPAYDVAHGQYWIHPALAEVVENALLGLDLAPTG